MFNIPVFLVEVTAITFFSVIAVGVEGPQGGLLDKTKCRGLSGNATIFFIVTPLFLLLPLIVMPTVDLLATLLIGAFTGGTLQDVTWFAINPHWGLRRFNSVNVTWLKWFKLGPIELPRIYVYNALGILTVLLLWSM